ncbi:hypothetical protein V6N13_107830 [Hibiscus sabdariffa]
MPKSFPTWLQLKLPSKPDEVTKKYAGLWKLTGANDSIHFYEISQRCSVPSGNPFALAYAAHKAASPIRFPPTVALTPIVLVG